MEAAASFDMFDVDAEPGPSALVGGCSSASFPSHGLPATVSSLDLDTVQQMIDSVESKRLTRYSSIYRQSSQIKITEDEIWMRRVQLCLSKLTMLDPGRRAHKANLYRYFHIWSLCLPLTQKCNELGKQLRERSAALESVRDSYNRDCIMVRLQLEGIYDQQDNATKRGELASVPSVDLRPLVQRSLRDPAGEPPSCQFQDLMVNGATAKYGNVPKLPWEYGKMFKAQKLNETGYEYRLPKIPVSIVDLHAPSRHKLLVRYCSDCVGLMTLVHDWNEAVEDGLNANVDNLQARGLRQLVRSLTDTTHAQEAEIHSLKSQLALAGPRESFIDKRLDKQADSDAIHLLTEKVRKWRAIAEMCDAERETVEGNIRINFNMKINRMREEFDVLMMQLNEKREECGYLQAEVEKMATVFSEHGKQTQLHREEVAQLHSQIAQQHLELNRCVRSREEVIKGITAKDAYILEQREEFLERIESLNEKISVQNAENEQQQSIIDELREQLGKAAAEAVQTRARFAADALSASETRQVAIESAAIVSMRYEDLRSAWHRSMLLLQSMPRDVSCDSISHAENDQKKAEIKRTLMLFPTKMRNSMANAIESVISLNQTQRRFSSAIQRRPSINAGGSRRPSTSLVPEVATVVEDEHRDDVSSVGNDMSDDDMSHAVQSVRSGRSTHPTVDRNASRRPSVAVSEAQSVVESIASARKSAGNTSSEALPADEVASHDQDNAHFDVEQAESEAEALIRESALLDNIKAGMEQLVETVLPDLHPDLRYDRRYPLRVVAIAVRFLLRLRHGLTYRRFSILGSYGLKLFVKSLQKNEDSRRLETVDTAAVMRLREELLSAEDTILQLREAANQASALRKVDLESIEKLRYQTDQLSEAQGGMRTALLRERMISRIQRHHAEYLATHISIFRARLHLMTHVSDIQKNTPPDMVPPPAKKSVEASLEVSKPTKKRGTVRMSFGSRAYSQEKRAREAAAFSDEDEEADVTRWPLYRVRNVFFHVLARLRKLKFDRPFRRANSKLLSAQHGKAISAWMLREEDILKRFVRDAAVELTEVEGILKRMRQQCSEDRRKAEAFRALLGVDTPLSVGISFVGEPPINAVSAAPASGGPCFSLNNGASPNIITPFTEVPDLKGDQYIGLDKPALRILAGFRHRDLRPELDFLKSREAEPESRVTSLTIRAGRQISARAQSTILETTIEESCSPRSLPRAPPLTHAHSMGESNVGSNSRDITPFKVSERQMEIKATLRQKLRRNAVSGPAGVRPDDGYTLRTTQEFELEKAAANEARLERKIDKLNRRVEEVEVELMTGYSEQARLQAELDLMIEDHEFLRKQNEALRVAISDSYRVCYEKTTDEVRKLGLDKQHFQQENMRNVSTQVACVPCDICVFDVRLGTHTHASTKQRSALATDNVIGPFADILEPYIAHKGDLAVTLRTETVNPDTVQTRDISLNEKQARTWEEMMHAHNRRTTSSPPKPRPMIKARPQSAIQLTTPKIATRDILAGPGDKESIYEMMQELRGTGTLLMDETSLEVRTATSRREMHHDVHNYATDVGTHGVHVSAAHQYLQYLQEESGRAAPYLVGTQRAGSSFNCASTYSKLKSFPRTQHMQSTASFSTLLQVPSISGNVPVRPNSARERGSKHLMIDLNKGRATELTKAESPGTVQGGAIAHMASALQVLHEARENQLAQKEIDSRRLYRSESDRIQEQQVVEQHDGLLVSGVIHHGGGSGRLVHEREPPSLTTRLPSVRPPLMLSRDVTPNSIPRLDKDWLPDEKEVRDNRRN